MKLPEKTFHSGWPEWLFDSTGTKYVRIRDGSQESEYTGAACLYGMVNDKFIDREYQYVPVSWTLAAKPVTFSGGPWINSGRLVLYGQPPLKMPKEPIEIFG